MDIELGFLLLSFVHCLHISKKLREEACYEERILFWLCARVLSNLLFCLELEFGPLAPFTHHNALDILPRKSYLTKSCEGHLAGKNVHFVFPLFLNGGKMEHEK